MRVGRRSIKVIFNEIGFSNDDDNSLACFNNLSSKRLVEFGVRLGSIDEESTDVGFFNRGKGTESREFFDANFTFTRFAQAGSIKDFNGATVIFDFDTVDIAGSSLTGADEGLLFLAKGIEKARFADVRATDESEFEGVIGMIGVCGGF